MCLPRNSNVNETEFRSLWPWRFYKLRTTRRARARSFTVSLYAVLLNPLFLRARDSIAMTTTMVSFPLALARHLPRPAASSFFFTRGHSLHRDSRWISVARDLRWGPHYRAPTRSFLLGLYYVQDCFTQFYIFKHKKYTDFVCISLSLNKFYKRFSMKKNIAT